MYSEKDFKVVRSEIQGKLNDPGFQSKLKTIIRDKGINLEDIQSQPNKIIQLMNDVDLIGGTMDKVFISQSQQERQQETQALQRKKISNWTLEVTIQTGKGFIEYLSKPNSEETMAVSLNFLSDR